MNPREETAAFLRARRARLRPSDVGLPDGVRRRTPGLRRQEVAQLAGMSIDYYIRLEQGRGPSPSKQVLTALARALMLTRDERDYLFRIAGQHPPAAPAPSRELTPAIRVLLASLKDVPAYVVDAAYTVLAWNDLAVHFLSDLSLVPEADRNMIRWMFRHPHGDDSFTRSTVADLRAAYARYPGDPGIESLVTELLGTSPRFAEFWSAHDVEERRRIVKSVVSPRLGPLEFECQVLQIPETGQRIIVYCAEPGSPTAEVFRSLSAVGP
ncbi:helix-turn-helix transcriptional regulator [Cryptosporangium phraense]|uniref:Helix-turn-helix domain-containing protein n=1 Tax=Cryptosporangium phraense TaxID=2593070 RepID=A0A545AWD8_9ACTN|nr:helix-turn-helix transcriptional regulator [Cryptosporangium phraense]TQS45638.1 helix-turn-helix domain-containing protein [Cryptosporangium phraense]